MTNYHIIHLYTDKKTKHKTAQCITSKSFIPSVKRVLIKYLFLENTSDLHYTISCLLLAEVSELHINAPQRKANSKE